MSDEVNLGGKTYISSKRAASSTGYAQDYIGQLARKGVIDARRIGGLWYIQLESLMNYKEKAQTYVPQPPKHENIEADPESLVFFDGKDYVSAAKAADITGYHPYYVGQLARGGKVISQQIGNRWYVDRAGILAHKEEKDDLLAAVQAESVGLSRRATAEGLANKIIDNNTRIDKDTNPNETKLMAAEAGPFLTYTTDTGVLMPNLEKKQGEERKSDDKVGEPEIEILDGRIAIPIHVNKPRVMQKTQLYRSNTVGKTSDMGHKIVSRLAKFYVPIAALLLVTVILFGFGASITGGKSATGGSGIFSKIGDVLEPFLTQELTYIRQN